MRGKPYLGLSVALDEDITIHSPFSDIELKSLSILGFARKK